MFNQGRGPTVEERASLPQLRAFKVRYLSGPPQSAEVKEAAVSAHRIDQEGGLVIWVEAVWVPQSEKFIQRWNRAFPVHVLIDFEEVVVAGQSSSGLVVVQ